jgi:S-formylglutathione hydrolase FrmB
MGFLGSCVTGRAISRRAALVAGLGVAVAGGAAAAGYGLVEAGTLPGKYRLAQLLGACGSAPAAPPRGSLPMRQETQFWSTYRRRRVTVVTLLPAGAATPRGLGVAVALHGLGGDAVSTARAVAPAMAATGTGPAGPIRLAVVTVDGGTTYWHRRADGDDPQGMIIYEVLPRLARLGALTGLIGIVGESMGGYGALLLAERLGAAARSGGRAGQAGGASGEPRAGAVAAISPAIFASYADARRADRRAFDGPADFARNDVLARLADLRDVPAYVACGDSDPFEPTAKRLRTRLRELTGREPAGGIEAGCHDTAFWARQLPPALEFLGGFLPVASATSLRQQDRP